MTLEQVKAIVEQDIQSFDQEQRAAFQRCAVEPYWAEIFRYGSLEKVAVVAQRGNEVIYWEDVEEGFNVSATDEAGRILHHFCNQDELGLALNAWIEGRQRSITLGPAGPVG